VQTYGATQAVGPVYPAPPHWPHSFTNPVAVDELDVVVVVDVELDVVVVVVGGQYPSPTPLNYLVISVV
jgi:hypothetical protein